MKYSRLGALLLALAAIVLGGRLFVNSGLGGIARSAEDTLKTLEMERYLNQPLELVDIKIGEQRVKDKIVRKSRYQNEGLDSVKFSERDDWLAHMD